VLHCRVRLALSLVYELLHLALLESQEVDVDGEVGQGLLELLVKPLLAVDELAVGIGESNLVQVHLPELLSISVHVDGCGCSLLQERILLYEGEPSNGIGSFLVLQSPLEVSF